MELFYVRSLDLFCFSSNKKGLDKEVSGVHVQAEQMLTFNPIFLAVRMYFLKAADFLCFHCDAQHVNNWV